MNGETGKGQAEPDCLRDIVLSRLPIANINSHKSARRVRDTTVTTSFHSHPRPIARDDENLKRLSKRARALYLALAK